MIYYISAFMIGFLIGVCLMIFMHTHFICDHEYEKNKTIEIVHYDEDRNPQYTEYVFVQTCKKCGKMKITRVLPTGR